MKTFNLIAFLSIIGLLSGCYPKGAEYVDELDVVISHYDPAGFKVGTFRIPDEIIYIKNGKPNEDADHSEDHVLLGYVEDHFTQNGFTLIDDETSDPKFVVVVTVFESDNRGYVWYPPGWGGWWGWWGPGWGYYPPYYGYYYNYKTGSVMIQLGDYENRDEEEETMETVYDGAVNGLLQGSESYIEARVKNGIDQLFKQVPFPVPSPM